MIKLTCSIFMSSNKSNFCIIFFIFFFIYIKMSEESSAKYYQDNKESLQKKAVERY